MQTDVLSQIGEIAEAEWNAIVPDGHAICEHAFLRAVEASSINDCAFFYPVARSEGRLVGHACVYVIDTAIDTFAPPALASLTRGVRRLWSRFCMMRSVECGTPVALGSTISIAPGVDRAAVLSCLVAAVEEIARQHRIGIVVFRDFEKEDRETGPLLSDRGYREIRNLPAALMAVRWNTFEEYLGDMRSSYRYKVRRHMRRFDEAGNTVEHVTDFAPFADDMCRLWRNTHDRATEYRREVLTEAFFRNISRELGERSSALLMMREGRPAAFALLVHGTERLTWLFSGLDYVHSRDEALYFRTIYETVRRAIDGGFREVNLGITTMVPKLDVGAQPAPLRMFIRHMRRGLTPLYATAMRTVHPPTEYEPRSVFKT